MRKTALKYIHSMMQCKPYKAIVAHCDKMLEHYNNFRKYSIINAGNVLRQTSVIKESTANGFNRKISQ